MLERRRGRECYINRGVYNMAGVSRAEVESIKRRFGIVGNSSALIQAIEVAYQVSSTDLSVLVLGESGAGKEFFP